MLFAIGFVLDDKGFDVQIFPKEEVEKFDAEGFDVVGLGGGEEGE